MPRPTLCLALLLALPGALRAQDSPAPWWKGTRLTPGVGWRALNIGMKAPEGEANLQPSLGSSMFLTLNVESPRVALGNSLAVSLLGYAGTVNADEQWVNGSPTATGQDGDGHRSSLGTSVSGHYRYLAPALTWGNRKPGKGGLELSAGLGWWWGHFAGDAIFAPNMQANAGMPKTPVAVDFSQPGYDTRIGLHGRNWCLILAVGGPFPFSQQGIRYEFQQIAMIVGYEFTL